MWWVRKRVRNDVVAFSHQADDKKVDDDMNEAHSMEVEEEVYDTMDSIKLSVATHVKEAGR